MAFKIHRPITSSTCYQDFIFKGIKLFWVPLDSGNHCLIKFRLLRIGIQSSKKLLKTYIIVHAGAFVGATPTAVPRESAVTITDSADTLSTTQTWKNTNIQNFNSLN